MGFRVEGFRLTFGVWVLGFRVEGLGVWAYVFRVEGPYLLERVLKYGPLGFKGCIRGIYGPY